MDRTTGMGFVLDANGRRVFVDQDLVAGRGGSDANAQYLTAVQEEIVSFVEAMRIVPNANDNTQLHQAVSAVVAIEAAARAAADTAEAAARYAADQSEAATRYAADVSEGNARAAADAAETSARQVADAALQADYIARDAVVLAAAETYADGTTTATAYIWPNDKHMRMATGVTVTGNGDQVNFNPPFPNACLGVVVCEAAAQPFWSANSTFTVYGASSATAAGFLVSCKKVSPSGVPELSPASGYSYIAWGN